MVFNTQGIRGVRTIFSIALLCVLSAALPASADPAKGGAAAAPAAADLAGRWQGRTFELARAEQCGDKPCALTLDLVPCASGWCGVEVVGAEQRCGATALRLDGGAANPDGGATVFKGKLELAKGTEPYVVEAYMIPASSNDGRTEMEITGDTGGEFRAFRRSFPFNATLARISDAMCRPESTVSLLD